MGRTRVFSPQTVRVMTALVEQPERWRYGYELGADVGLRSGSLYPILMRLADRGLLESRWDDGRPPRHLYRLTADGQQAARAPAPSAAAVRPVVREA